MAMRVSRITRLRRVEAHEPTTAWQHTVGLAACLAYAKTLPPRDPWDGEYRYRLLPDGDARKFELKSVGPDGQLGTVDDLSSLDPR